MSQKKKFIIAGAGVAAAACIAAGVHYFTAFGARADGAAAAKPSIGLVEMESFLTNINDANGKHHARLQLKIAISPESVATAVKGNPLLMARMRDQGLTLLTSKTYQELSQSEGKERFRGEIAERLAPLLPDGKVSEILFSDFVVQ